MDHILVFLIINIFNSLIYSYTNILLKFYWYNKLDEKILYLSYIFIIINFFILNSLPYKQLLILLLIFIYFFYIIIIDYKYLILLMDLYYKILWFSIIFLAISITKNELINVLFLIIIYLFIWFVIFIVSKIIQYFKKEETLGTGDLYFSIIFWIILSVFVYKYWLNIDLFIYHILIACLISLFLVLIKKERKIGFLPGLIISLILIIYYILFYT